MLYFDDTDGSEYINVGIDNSSPGHGGNASKVNALDTWSTQSGDFCFYAYGQIPSTEIDVNDSITLSEDVTVEPLAVNPNVFDSVAVAEDLEMFKGIMTTRGKI